MKLLILLAGFSLLSCSARDEQLQAKVETLQDANDFLLNMSCIPTTDHDKTDRCMLEAIKRSWKFAEISKMKKSEKYLQEAKLNHVIESRSVLRELQ